MMRAVIALSALTALSGCDLLFPEDPRLGVETAEECAARVEGLLGPTNSYRTHEGASGVPIFTYDITKLALDDVQALTVPGSDETAGNRLMAQSNTEATAVARFMELEVSDKGAFFLARDPALYRVRGPQEPIASMVATGCARQDEGMRLIMIDIARSVAPLEPDTDTSLETETSE